MPTPDPDPAQAPHDGHLTRSARVLAVMLKLGTIAFGGPAVHIAMLRDETVRRQWLEDASSLTRSAPALPSWPSGVTSHVVLGDEVARSSQPNHDAPSRCIAELGAASGRPVD